MAQYRLRFFFDPGSGTCLWAADEHTKEKFDYLVDPAKLPIEENLWRRVYYVAAWYDTSIDWRYPPDPTPWQAEEKKRFELTVQALLADLRKALDDEFEIRDEYKPFS